MKHTARNILKGLSKCDEIILFAAVCKVSPSPRYPYYRIIEPVEVSITKSDRTSKNHRYSLNFKLDIFKLKLNGGVSAKRIAFNRNSFEKVDLIFFDTKLEADKYFKSKLIGAKRELNRYKRFYNGALSFNLYDMNKDVDKYYDKYI